MRHGQASQRDLAALSLWASGHPEGPSLDQGCPVALVLTAPVSPSTPSRVYRPSWSPTTLASPSLRLWVMGQACLPWKGGQQGLI